jgi:hypothetical protein
MRRLAEQSPLGAFGQSRVAGALLRLRLGVADPLLMASSTAGEEKALEELEPSRRLTANPLALSYGD